MEQKKSESSCLCEHEEELTDVVKQGQQSVFPEWLSQSQQWGDVGGIKLTNFVV